MIKMNESSFSTDEIVIDVSDFNDNKNIIKNTKLLKESP